MHKAGRYTAALLLVAVGASVIADQYAGSHWTDMLIQWWPVLFVALGIEYILFNMKYGESEKQLKLDIGGVVFAVVISALVIGSTQSASALRNWFGHFDLGVAMNSITKGESRKFDKGVTEIPIDAGVNRIVVKNPSGGNIVLQQGTADELQIQSIVYVALEDEQEAGRIAEQTRLEHSVGGGTLTIKAEGNTAVSGFWQQFLVRTDLVISVPPHADVDMNVESSNGQITAGQLKFPKEFKANTTNGTIQLSSLEALKVDLESTNARIVITDSIGKLRAETTNGEIQVTGHQGDVELESTNGGLTLSQVSGSMDVETTNGNIQISEAPQAVKARTTNGSVEVSAHKVDGDWSVETSHGDIRLELPSAGDYTVKGSGENGSIRSELPLDIGKKSVNGTVGSGKNKIQIDTKGSISIRRSS
ncbi:DUF4097 family beta strand repeat-containing protein [Paenibacillus doosanensis]|uniref:DUF4097 family beta strand repeat-containing protein n=1 Tax=Paenibacillus doosanensis TaxID=1229154 RepID=UPI00217F8CF6|nr:DUF4097 family beta strand repeat-containing protein [Paenibacillus doosanensis]MCS7461378.1 DUF4097 family beta strand repeat-containing protein [Paenibacillus doosanensis]